jgi:serine/threonine-protein kinase
MASDTAGPHDDLRARLQAALGGGYAVERELGGGGMSRVFVARDTRLGRHVAVKVLHPDLAADVSSGRFEREITLAARLQHPHLVPLLSAGAVDGAPPLPFYTMPFVEGETLRARLTRVRALPVDEAVRLLRELADALAYAHEQGVMHRDLKPENVLLARGHALVADFGVAKALASATQGTSGAPVSGGTATRLGMAVGTPAYMAPEQAVADPATDHRADLYALGVIAYEAVAGAHPFAGRSPQALVAAHLTETPAPLGIRRSEAPAGLDALVQRLLAKRPDERPATAAAVLRELEGLDTRSATAAAAVEAPRQRRTRRAAAVAVAVLLLGLALVSAGLVVRGWRSSRDAAGATPDSANVAARAPVGIAILPFESRGPAGDPQDADFADGLADAVRSQLAQLPALRVIDGRSAGQYRGTTKSVREIGRELGVPYVLQTTVRWARGPDGVRRVQVSPALVRVADAATVWAVPVTPEPSDVFATQAAVARQVADALDVRLGARERALLEAVPTRNAAAYEAYLRGLALAQRAFLTPDPGSQAMATEAFARAVALDPGFGAAWAYLAAAHLNRAMLSGGRDADRLALARAALDSAERLAPKLAETHQMRGFWAHSAEGDVAKATAALRAAVAARPSDAGVLQWLGTALVSTPGGLEEGVAFSMRAADLDPRSAERSAHAALRLRMAGRAREAIRYADRALALAPDQFVAYDVKAVALIESGAGVAAARAVLDSASAHLGATAVTGYLVGTGSTFPTLNPSGILGEPYASRLAALTLAEYAPAAAADSAAFYLAKADHWRLRRDNGRVTASCDSARAVLVRMAGDVRPELVARAAEGTLAANLALAYACLGRRVEARRWAGALDAAARGRSSPWSTALAGMFLARTHVLLGEPDSAVVQLERALVPPRVLSPALLRVDPFYAPLRGHPGFERLVARGAQ